MRVNSFSGQIPSSIGNLTQLSEQYLSQNKLGAIPASIANCQNLQLLEISQNNLSGSIPPQVVGLSPLTQLANFSQNSLTGCLLVEVGKLIHINTLDISKNNLFGEIPKAIGDCQSLEYLNIQGNSFQGIIPQSLTSFEEECVQHEQLTFPRVKDQIVLDQPHLYFRHEEHPNLQLQIRQSYVEILSYFEEPNIPKWTNLVNIAQIDLVKAQNRNQHITIQLTLISNPDSHGMQRGKYEELLQT